MAKKIIELLEKQSAKKVPKRLLDGIYVIKKSLLNNNESNRDPNLLNSLHSPTIQFQHSYKPALFELPQNSFIFNGQAVKSGEFVEDRKALVLYFGCAILSIAIKADVVAVAIQVNSYEGQKF